MRTPEGYEKNEVRKYLKSIGAYVFAPVQQGFGVPTVDFLVCINGTFWGVEVKKEGGTPTARQIRTANEIMAAGGRVAWGTAGKIIAEIEAWRVARPAA